jgi:hypothetical protein
MLSVLANQTYRHLFAAQIIALIGTGMMTVALGLLAFKIAGDKAGAVLGTVAMPASIPIRHRGTLASRGSCEPGQGPPGDAGCRAP